MFQPEMVGKVFYCKMSYGINANWLRLKQLIPIEHNLSKVSTGNQLMPQDYILAQIFTCCMWKSVCIGRLV